MCKNKICLYCIICCKIIIKKNKKLFKKVLICKKCTKLCNYILKIEKNYYKSKIIKIKPKTIYKYINKYIIGHKHVKKQISTLIYLHTKISKKTTKKNFMIIGPTGTGKTLLINTLKYVIKLPIITIDASNLTETGYVGEDVETILIKLIEKCDYNIKIAEKGIVFIDEIDKIAKKKNKNIENDISKTGVQQALLKILENTNLRISINQNKKIKTNKTIYIKTKNILFIAGGAFTNMYNKKNKLFNENSKKISYILKLKNYGLIPEFISRFQYILILKNQNIKNIIKSFFKIKNNILAQTNEILNSEKTKFKITKKAIIEISKKVNKINLGMRGIEYIFNKFLIKKLYYLSSFKGKKFLIIDKKSIKYNILKLKQKL